MLRTLTIAVFALWVLPACNRDSPFGDGQGSRALGSLDWRAPTRPTARILEDGTPCVPDEVLVRVSAELPPSSVAGLAASRNATVLHSYRFQPGLHLLRLPPGIDVASAAAAYHGAPGVLSVEPNVLYFAENIPGDPLFASQWGLRNSGQEGGTPGADIHAVDAWDATTGSEQVVIALNDTGIDYLHEDLAANVWQNPGEIPGNGIDDDENGYVDDVAGVNVITGTGDPMDVDGHGTHTAGTVGAVGQNGIGVAGVAWNVKLLACKFIGPSGTGTLADALKCMDYLLELKTRASAPVNIVASSNSWNCSSPSCNSAAMREAIKQHMDAGMLFLAAAGNAGTNNDVAESWPAKYYLPNVLAVAATDDRDAKPGFSNYGRQTVHLGAPGVGIASTVPGNSYRNLSGTSMATPHVTGVAALLAAQDPTRDWRAIKNLLLAGREPIASLSTSTLTGGRLQAWGTGGTGALNCSNQVLTRRLQPVVTQSQLTTVVGTPVPIAVLNINCSLPAGEVDVQVSGADSRTIRLRDDGLGTDLAASDGIYSGQLVPVASGVHTLAFPGGQALSLNVLNTYGAAEHPPAVYETLTPASIRIPGAGDDTVSAIQAPFPIRFADLAPGFSTLYVGSNGYVGFGPVPAGASQNTPLPSSFFQPGVVFPWWQNLDVPSEAPFGLYYETLGAAPHRKFVVEWRDVIVFNTSPETTLRFQVVFFEGRSDVEINYANVDYRDPEYDNGAAATVGIQVLPTAAQQFSYATPSLTNDSTLLFRTFPLPNVPVASEPGMTPGHALQGQAVDVTATFSEPNGTDGPWTVEWDCHYGGAAFVPEQVQTSPAQGPISATCLYPNDGHYMAAVRIRGRLGGESAVAATAFDVADVGPRIQAFAATPSSGDEPLTVDFRVTVGPAPAGSADPIADYEWDFDGDGQIDLVTVVPTSRHVYGDNPRSGGVFQARVRVRDLDSAADAVAPIVVRNVPPSIDAVQPDQTALEGALYRLSIRAHDPGAEDVLAYALAAAPEGMTIDAAGVIHWVPTSSQCGAEPGMPHAVTVQVSDGDGGVASLTFSVRAVVSPLSLVDPAPLQSAVEEIPFTYQVRAMGGVGPLSFALLSAPEGMVIDASGLVTWTPRDGQCSKLEGAAHTVNVLAWDRAGAGAVTGFVVYATWLDTDGDGMSDDWEIVHGCDPAMDDAQGDVTGDGIINIDKFNNDTGGPYTPEPVALSSPRDGERIPTRDVTLAVEAASDRDTDAGLLGYAFEIYADAELKSRVLAATGLSSVLVRVPQDAQLLPRRRYWWRARATDGAHPGAWSQARSFWYLTSELTVEQKLAAPHIVSPVAGAVVQAGSPTLTIANVSHAAGEEVTYDFELYEGDLPETMIGSLSGVPEQAEGRTSVTLTGLQLAPGDYFWRTRASSASAGTGDWTEKVPIMVAWTGCGCGSTGPNAQAHLVWLAIVALLCGKRPGARTR